MQVSLSSEQQKMIIDNWGLVRYVVKKLSIPYNEYEDAVSIGTIGLIKAVNSYDDAKGVKFATFACKCISNEIFMNYRKEKLYKNEVSLDGALTQDIEDNELLLSDVLMDTSIEDVLEQMVNKELICKFLSIILNRLSVKEKIIYLYSMSGMKQKSIAEVFNFSQSYIARVVIRVQSKTKEYLRTNEKYREVFAVELMDDKFYISFFSKDVINFKKAFINFLLETDKLLYLPEFKVISENKRVVICIPADIESFAFIAKFVEQMDEFKLTYKKASKKVPSNDEDSEAFEEIEQCDKVEGDLPEESQQCDKIENDLPEESQKCDKIKNDLPEESQKCDERENNLPEEGEESLKNQNDKKVVPIRKKKYGKKNELIRQYMITLGEFTLENLIDKFPDVPVAAIRSVIYREKCRETIFPLKRGKYSVKK
jgi:RNA polymerase sporulation-specific sigma factor